jgi:hypothetical protein
LMGSSAIINLPMDYENWNGQFLPVLRLIAPRSKRISKTTTSSSKMRNPGVSMGIATEQGASLIKQCEITTPVFYSSVVKK